MWISAYIYQLNMKLTSALDLASKLDTNFFLLSAFLGSIIGGGGVIIENNGFYGVI